MKRLCILIIFGLFWVTGCGETTTYVKQGAKEGDLDAAIVDCNNQLATRGDAVTRLGGGIDAGTLGAGDVTRAGMLEHRKNLDLCLRAKGWTPQTSPK